MYTDIMEAYRYTYIYTHALTTYRAWVDVEESYLSSPLLTSVLHTSVGITKPTEYILTYA